MKNITYIILTLCILLLVYRNDNCHKCKWSKCPYKGIYPSQWSDKVSLYVGETGTDAWCIDMLHLEYPNKEYDELEDLLFSNK